MTPEEEKLQLLGVIQSNRHKLAPDEQQAFDEIVRQAGPTRVPGTVANTASTRLSLAHQTSRPISPYKPSLDDRGYLHSMANAVSIPTNSDELQQMGPTLAANMFLPGLGSGMQTVRGLASSRSLQDVNRVLNPMVAPMEQMGEGNIRGGLGSATPFVAGSLAMPFIPGPKPAPSTGVRVPGKPGGGMRINLVSDGLPAPTLPEVWNGPPPSGTMPVYGEPTTIPPSRLTLAGEYGARELANKIPGLGTLVSDAVKGKIARPRTGPPARVGTIDLSKQAAYGDAPVQGGSRTSAFVKPRRIPVADELPDVWTGSEPQSIGNLDLEQPAAYGDAPNQGRSPTSAFAKPRTVGPEFEPRGTGGKFSPRKSIPLKSDVVPTATAPSPKPRPTQAPATKSKPPVGFSTTSPPFSEGDAVTLSGNKVATVLSSDPETTTVRTGKVTARLPTARLQLGAEAVEPAARVGTTKNPAGPQPVGKTGPKTSSKPVGNVEWTDRTGSRLSGTVVTELKSKSGPAYIVRDSSGKSRFVHVDRLT